MPIKIFAAPGDHRDDFASLEEQVNRWIEQVQPRIVCFHTTVNEMPGKRDIGDFMMTLVAHYESAAADGRPV